jgi:hypothetical protein
MSSPASTRSGPRAKLRSFLTILPTSPPFVKSGRRVAIELSHRTWLVLARILITWLLLVGSSNQSLAKQTMF